MDKAGPLVRSDRPGTRVDRDVLGSVLPRKIDEPLNELSSDSGVAKCRCDKHGLDVCGAPSVQA